MEKRSRLVGFFNEIWNGLKIRKEKMKIWNGSKGGLIKAWIDNVELEDEALKQIENVASMPFIHKHVAIMPDVHWGMGCTIGSVIATHKAIIPASVGVDIGCFSGNTKIILVEDYEKSLKQLYEETKGESFFRVYSMDISSLMPVRGYARCIKTRENADLMKIIVRQDEQIICTPDHLFMLMNGSYKKAEDLSLDDKLMAVAHNLGCCIDAIEHLDYKEDVYCLQVEKYHNFALSAGVFVHNCGMMAVQTSLTASDLPDSLAEVRTEIEKAVPHGRTNDGKVGDRGAWGNPDPTIIDTFNLSLRDELKSIIDLNPNLGKHAFERAPYQLGTLGTGNHFIEVCLDENQNVWIMLHSGSRGIGNKIGTYFIEKAKKEMERWFIHLPDKDLAYFPEGSIYFDQYMQAVKWAQLYASVNRKIMMDNTIDAIKMAIKKPFEILDKAINCHHNYVNEEKHFGSSVYVTRKGAVRARKDDLGIIPGSMGAKSFIVKGKGNLESFQSCSHGAGRKLSRSKAKKIFSLEDHIKATEGVECRKDLDVIDETPGAYKNLDMVMKAQEDLVEIVHTLKQIVCVKG